MFKDKYHPKVKKDLKKIDKPIQKDIIDIHLVKILENPTDAGNQLQGNLNGIYAYHFIKNKVEFRIAYIIEAQNEIVYILSIAKRENFYDILKKRQ